MRITLLRETLRRHQAFTMFCARMRALLAMGTAQRVRMGLMAEVLRVSFLLVGIAVCSHFVCARFANVGCFLFRIHVSGRQV